MHSPRPAGFRHLLGPARARQHLHRRRSVRSSLVFPVVAGLLVSIGSVVHSTDAAFTADTAASVSLAAGTVTLSNDASSSALISVNGLLPGAVLTRCVTVTYGGSVPARVRLGGTLGGTGLAAHLSLRLRRGTFVSPPAGGGCSGFVADTADHVGSGAGVVYSGPLDSFPTTWDQGVVDPSTTNSAVPQLWTTGDQHAYEVQLTLDNDNAAQGLTATWALTWEARSAGDASAAYAAAVMADHPEGYWRLRETSGTVAADETGRHPGTYSAGVTLGVPGPLGGGDGAASFNGVDAHVEIPWAAALNPASFTVEAWARSVASVPGYEAVVASYEDPPQNGYGLWALGGDWNSYMGNGSNGYATASAPRTGGVWTHLVATYDGTSLLIYADGQLIQTTVAPLGLNTSAPMTIGSTKYGATAGWTEPFEGAIDEVAVYGSVLSPQRILAHYQAAMSG